MNDIQETRGCQGYFSGCHAWSINKPRLNHHPFYSSAISSSLHNPESIIPVTGASRPILRVFSHTISYSIFFLFLSIFFFFSLFHSTHTILSVQYRYPQAWEVCKALLSWGTVNRTAMYNNIEGISHGCLTAQFAYGLFCTWPHAATLVPRVSLRVKL